MQAANRPQAGQTLTRALEIEQIRAEEGENEGQRIRLAFSSEVPYRRWYGDEILSHREGAVDLTRIRDVGVVLFAHGQDERAGRMPIAKITDVRVDADNIGRAEIEFDESDEFAQTVLRKIRGGYIRGVSVGYRVNEWEELSKKGQVSSDGNFTAQSDDTYIAVRWEPYEISIEPIPADPTVGVGRGMENNNLGGGNRMPEITNPIAGAPQTQPEQNRTTETQNQQTQNQQRTTEPEGAAPQAQSSAGEGIEAERARAADILALCSRFGIDAAEYIRGGNTVDQVRAAILDQLAKNNQPSSIRVTQDEGDKLRGAVSDAILMRTGASMDAERASAARSFRGMRLRAIADECMVRAGVQNPQYMDDDEAFRRAMSPDAAFASILDATVQKSISAAYAAAPTTFEAITRAGTLSDFKPAKVYRISEAGDLVEIKQGGEFTFDEMTDSGATAQLVTYGRTWGFTRQAMINDDLSVLTSVPAAYVRACKRGINKAVYSRIAGITYNSSKGNLGTAGKISVGTVGELRAKMRTQKNIRGKEVLNIEGRIIAVPAELEVAAMELVNSTANPAGANSGVANVFRNALNVVVDAELDTYSTTAYYLIADPMDLEGIRVSYLNGKREPNLESRSSWDRLGMEWRIYMDYGVDVIDEKAFAKNAGQA